MTTHHGFTDREIGYEPLVPPIGGLFGGTWRLKSAKPSALTTLMTVSCPWAGRPVTPARGGREISSN
jgi:hypothetical protein